MFKIMDSDEAVKLIHDGDVICLNSFVGIENPVELHEALYRRYKATGSPAPYNSIKRRLRCMGREPQCGKLHKRGGCG